jgi:hypothetical protein
MTSDTNQVTAAEFSVTNLTGSDISVSLSTWGEGGQTGWFQIENTHTERWGRKDDRGYLMVVKAGILKEELPYFVYKNSTITLMKSADPVSPIDVRDVLYKNGQAPLQSVLITRIL